MRCSVETCRNDGAHRVVIITRGVLAGQSVRVRIQLPIVACDEHSRPGAFWGRVLRIVPRTFAALLANCGISVPQLHRTRVRFVPVGHPRVDRREGSSPATHAGGWE